MNHTVSDSPPSSSHLSNFVQFTLRWTPRTIIAGLSGYYCLGIAYEVGAMAAIDRIAIRTLRSSLGYMAIAALMPTFQWYSAWGVRFIAALSASLIYCMIEKILSLIYNTFFTPRTSNISINRTSIHDQHPDLKKALTQRKQ